MDQIDIYDKVKYNIVQNMFFVWYEVCKVQCKPLGMFSWFTLHNLHNKEIMFLTARTHQFGHVGFKMKVL